MVKADLITGFLGSGKTTFIRKYVSYLLDQGEKIGILENDYGAINVDMMLLSDLKSDRLGLEMVAGGCDHDCHIRRFRTKLITMAMLGYTRVIIEPSGIFDVDEFFDIMHEDPLYDRYEIGNVITIVKPEFGEEYSEGMDYLLASQIAQAGCVVLSHADEVDENAIRDTVAHMNRALARIRCDRTFSLEENVIAKPWDSFTPADYERLAGCRYQEIAFEKNFSMDDNPFQSMFFMNLDLPVDEVLGRVRQLFEDPGTGHVIRVKGFLKEEKGDGWLELNATARETNITRISDGQEVLIVIGENLREEAVDRYFPAKYSTVRFRGEG